MDFATQKSKTLLVERSDAWINLHHMFEILPRPIHPHEIQDIASATMSTKQQQQQQQPPSPSTSMVLTSIEIQY